MSSSGSTRGSDAAQLAAAKLAVQVQRFTDDADGVLNAEHVLDDDLLVLERLVVFEEAADLPQGMPGNLSLVGVLGKRGIAHAHGDDLVVDALLVAHPHHANRACLYQG